MQGPSSPAKPPASRSPTWSIDRRLQQLSPFVTPTRSKQAPGPMSSAQRYTVQSPSAPSRKSSPGPLSPQKNSAKSQGISPASLAAKPAAEALNSTAGHPRPSSSPPEVTPTQLKDSAHGCRTSSVGSPGQGSPLQRQEGRSGHHSPSSSLPLGAHAKNSPLPEDCSSAQPGLASNYSKGLSEASGAQPRRSRDEHTSLAVAAAAAALALSPHRPSSTHSSPCPSMRGEPTPSAALPFARSQRAIADIKTPFMKRLCCCCSCIACPSPLTEKLYDIMTNWVTKTSCKFINTRDPISNG